MEKLHAIDSISRVDVFACYTACGKTVHIRDTVGPRWMPTCSECLDELRRRQFEPKLLDGGVK